MNVNPNAPTQTSIPQAENPGREKMKKFALLILGFGIGLAVAAAVSIYAVSLMEVAVPVIAVSCIILGVALIVLSARKANPSPNSKEMPNQESNRPETDPSEATPPPSENEGGNDNTGGIASDVF